MPDLDRCAARGLAPEVVRADLAALCRTHTMQHLGKRLNVSAASISDTKNGKVSPGLKMLQALYGPRGTTLRPDLQKDLPEGYTSESTAIKTPDTSLSLPALLARLTEERDAAEAVLDELEGELATLQALISRHTKEATT